MSGYSRVVLGLVAALVLIALVACTALAEVPKKINYQMRITDTDTGEPLPGSHNLTFRICQYELSGGVLWTEAHSVTADTAGVVSVILGSTTPIDISLNGERWLEVEVDTEVLSPRRELVSVPFALSADTAGQAANADSLGGMAAAAFLTDGHSLDAADGNPVDVVYVNEYGRVGVGTTSPGHRLHVYDDQDIATQIVIENTNDGNQGWQGLDFMDESNYGMGIHAYEVDDAFNPAVMRIYNDRFEGDIRFQTGGFDHVIINHNGRLGINVEEPSADLDVNGSIETRLLYLGNETSAGALYLRPAGSGIPVIEMGSATGGGRLTLNTTSGNTFVDVFPDSDPGGGGFFQVTRNNSTVGVSIDGNYNGTQSPRLSMYGTSSAYLNMNETGDQSVILPAGAISNSEILDEPGVASVTAHDTSPTALAMQAGFNTLASRTISAPSQGYVLALGSAQPTINHSGGTHSQAEFGVSDISGSFPTNQDCLLRIPAENVSAVYTFPITVHGLFQVGSAGNHTFYFLGNKATGTFTANDVHQPRCGGADIRLR